MVGRKISSCAGSWDCALARSTMSGANAFQGQDQPPPAGPLGHVHSVTGSKVSIGLAGRRPGGLYGAGMTVGKFVKMHSGKALIVGVIAEVSIQAPSIVAGS